MKMKFREYDVNECPDDGPMGLVAILICAASVIIAMVLLAAACQPLPSNLSDLVTAEQQIRYLQEAVRP
jgi:hypothetical protein